MFHTLFITILSSCNQTFPQLGNGKHDHVLYIMRNLMKKCLIKSHRYLNQLHQMSVWGTHVKLRF